jgi:hypothetical protein
MKSLVGYLSADTGLSKDLKQNAVRLATIDDVSLWHATLDCL